MKIFKKSFELQIRVIFLMLSAAAAAFIFFILNLTLPVKVALMVIVFLIAVVHWDIRDGGLISKFVYRQGGTRDQRNHLTVVAAYTFVTVIITVGEAWRTPLLMLYCIPIVLAALRIGRKGGIFYGLGLSAGLGGYYLISGYVNGSYYEFALYYVLLFSSLATATALIADRLRKAAVDLSALYETGRALNSLLNTKEILALILNIVMLDVQPDVAAVFLLDPKRQVLRLKAQRGITKDVRDWEEVVGRGLIGKAAAGMEPIVVSKRDRRWRLRQADDLASMIALPIKVGRKLLGVFLVGKRANHAFSFDNVRFLESLSSQAAISIQTARLYRRTQEWASLDGLTGIYNFRFFSERLEVEWTRAVRYGKPLSLIMIDIDLFKLINDRFGHPCGDKILCDFSRLLKEHVRETDILARYGGEEFVIILPETHYQDAYQVAEKLRRRVAEAEFRTVEDEVVKLTISLGVAGYPTTASSRTDLIYQADQALYRAKNKRNALATPLGAAGEIDIPSEIAD